MTRELKVVALLEREGELEVLLRQWIHYFPNSLLAQQTRATLTRSTVELVRAHGRREHVGSQVAACPVCQRFPERVRADA